MSNYIFYLSGEHPNLPFGEVTGALESLNCNFKVKDRFDQFLIVNISNFDPRISERLGLSHMICEILGSGKNLDNSIKSCDLTFKGSFSVRVIGDTSNIEPKAGKLIQSYSKKNPRVDLDNPDNEINIFYSENKEKYFITKKLSDIDRGEFEDRRAHLRPYQHPSSLHPRLSRALINLSRASKETDILDPMVGTGGILIEAGLLGIKGYGVDIEQQMIDGARKNLNKYINRNKYDLKVGDARNLDEMFDRKFKAAITDPPYGISTTTGESSRNDLYDEILSSIYDILSEDGYLVIIFPSDYKLDPKGFKVLETYEQRVHKTLSRKFYVLTK